VVLLLYLQAGKAKKNLSEENHNLLKHSIEEQAGQEKDKKYY
jgi:hypothetical protein